MFTASSRGQPHVEQSSITIISKLGFSYPRLLFILNMSIKRSISRKILLEEEASIRSSYIQLILFYCKALLILTFITSEYIVIPMYGLGT
jgi:hypothetical protein